MNAIVVYESIWGNTAAVAHAIAAGLGEGTRAYAPDEVPREAVATADLLVAGAPVLGFSLPTEPMRGSIAADDSADAPPDLSHPSLRSWLDALPEGRGRSAAFETRIWWSPRGATGTIEKKLAAVGYEPIHRAGRFIVGGKTGPLRKGELERARRWGAELRSALEGSARQGPARDPR